jgi:hypothetical protein
MLALRFQHVSQRVAAVCRSFFLNLRHLIPVPDGFDYIPCGRPSRRNAVIPYQESGRFTLRYRRSSY